MGVKGAAVATILSQAVSAVWVFSFLNGKQTKLRIRKEYLKVQPQIILPVMGLGLAPFVMNITESLINIAFNASLSKYGGDVAVGAMTILASIMQLQFMPVQGLGQGAQPLISYNYGAAKALPCEKDDSHFDRGKSHLHDGILAVCRVFPGGFCTAVQQQFPGIV